MRKYIARGVVLSALILTGSAIGQYTRMTNQTILAMVRGGVSVSTITHCVLMAQEIVLNANQQEAAQLVQAGASEADANLIMKAIERRANGGPGDPNYRRGGPRGENLVVPENTRVRLRLARNLSSAHTRTDDEVEFEVLQDVFIPSTSGTKFLVIERGARAWGTITDASPMRILGRAGKVEVTVDFVMLANGDRIALTATEQGKRDGHPGYIVDLLSPAAFFYFPKDPFWLFIAGKESAIKEGLDITALTVGVANLDSLDFEQRPGL